MTSNAQFLALGARDFFRRYPVTAVVNHPGGVAYPGVVNGNTRPKAVGAQSGVDSTHRIMSCDFGPDNSPFWNVSTPACGPGAKIAIGNGAIHLYHLPYNNDQNWRITLRDRQGVGNADFFVTELVNGCSVYVEGTAQEPTVYHINAISAQRGWSFWSPFRWTEDSRRRADWVAKYQSMDQRFHHDKQKPKDARNGVAGLRPATKVENHDHMTPLQMAPAIEAQLPHLQFNGKSPTVVGGQSVDSMRYILSEGSVFGVRPCAGGNWKFYIQKRVLVEYFHHNAGGFASLGCQQIVLSVDQFWPQPKTGRLV